MAVYILHLPDMGRGRDEEEEREKGAASNKRKQDTKHYIRNGHIYAFI